VAVSNDYVLVGAGMDPTWAFASGAAYLFNAQTGAYLRTFTNPTPAVVDMFGWSVALSGNNILIGAPGDDTGAGDAGAVYLFDALSGALLRTFTNPAPAVSDTFGYAVAVERWKR
jgi:hypothetical protein